MTNYWMAGSRNNQVGYRNQSFINSIILKDSLILLKILILSYRTSNNINISNLGSNSAMEWRNNKINIQIYDIPLYRFIWFYLVQFYHMQGWICKLEEMKERLTPEKVLLRDSEGVLLEKTICTQRLVYLISICGDITACF